MTAKSQTALEYLVTYGWVILIIAVALGALYALGIFNTNAFVNDVCAMPADFSCQGTALGTSGFLSINITQDTGDPINITAIACSSNQSLAYADRIYPAAYLPNGGNHTFFIQCYTNSTPFTGAIGSVYHGYIIVNYTDLATSFQYTSVGTAVLKAKTYQTKFYFNSAQGAGTSNSLFVMLPGYSPGFSFCEAVSIGGLSSASWLYEAGDQAGIGGIGHISGGGSCSGITSSSNYWAAAGVATNASTESLIASGQYNFASGPVTFNYVVANSAQSTIIMLISTNYKVTVTPPGGCSQEENPVLSGSEYQTAYIALCYNQPVGTYTVNVFTSGNPVIGYGIYSVK